MKRFLISAFVVLFGALGLALAPATTVNALDCDSEAKSAVNAFLNFPTWYRGFKLKANTQGDACILDEAEFKDKEVGSIIFTIALNVLDIVLRLAGLIAVGFVMWGGFHYILSHGEPEHAKKSINIIRNALIGLVISMIATVAVSFIVWRLGQTSP